MKETKKNESEALKENLIVTEQQEREQDKEVSNIMLSLKFVTVLGVTTIIATIPPLLCNYYKIFC